MKKITLPILTLILFNTLFGFLYEYFHDGKKRVNNFTGTVEWYREDTFVKETHDYDNHTLSSWEIDQVIDEFYFLVRGCKFRVYDEEKCNKNDDGTYKINSNGDSYFCDSIEFNGERHYYIDDGCGLKNYYDLDREKLKGRLGSILKKSMGLFNDGSKYHTLVKFDYKSVDFDKLPDENQTWIKNKVNEIKDIVLVNIPIKRKVYEKGWTTEKKYLNGKNTSDDRKYK